MKKSKNNSRSRSEKSYTEYVPHCPAFVQLVAHTAQLFGLDGTGNVWQYAPASDTGPARWERIGRAVHPGFLDD